MGKCVKYSTNGHDSTFNLCLLMLHIDTGQNVNGLSIQRSFASGSHLMGIFHIHLMIYLLECGAPISWASTIISTQAIGALLAIQWGQVGGQIPVLPSQTLYKTQI